MNDLPEAVKKYFWGDDPNDLSWQNNQQYITETILEKGDRDAVRWLFSRIEKTKLKELIPNLHLSAISANFWRIYLS